MEESKWDSRNRLERYSDNPKRSWLAEFQVEINPEIGSDRLV